MGANMARSSLTLGPIAAILAAMLVTPAAAADLCDDFARYGAPEIEATREWLAMSVPVDDVPAAKRLRIAVLPSPELGPEIELGDDDVTPTIIVPESFRRRHCRMIIIFYEFSAIPGLDYGALQNEMRACTAQHRSDIDCLDQIIGTWWVFASKWLSEGEAKSREFYRVLLDGSYNGVILHEFAHYTRGHLEILSPSASQRRKFEFEADSYASFFGAIAESGLFYGFTFNFLSNFEHLLQPTSSPHGTYKCRYGLGTALGFQISMPASLASYLPTLDTAEVRTRLHNLARGEFDDTDTKIPRGCTVPPRREIRTIQADIQAVAVVQSLMPNPLSRDLRAKRREVIARFTQLRPASDIGKYLKFKVISQYADYLAFQDSPVEMDWFFQEIGFDQNRRYFRGEDYGKLWAMRAWALYDALSPTDVAPEKFAELHSALEQSAYYNPPLTTSVTMLDALLYRRANQCDKALERYRAALQSAGPGDRDLIGPIRRAIADLEALRAIGKCPPLVTPAPSSAAR